MGILMRLTCACSVVAALVGCGGVASSLPSARTTQRSTIDDEERIERVLDGWHEAAAASDEDRYFRSLTSDAIFLGTDQTERWDVPTFRAYAHGPFSQGRGWRMRAVRRDVVVHGDVAWFDEVLETVNLGPARGSGVLRRVEEDEWKISQYNLALTIPNARFAEVHALLTRAFADAEAFVSLQALVGGWRAQTDAGEVHAAYSLISNDSALVEDWRTPRGSRTVSVYHPNGNTTVLTHYCAQQNAARLQLSSSQRNGAPQRGTGATGNAEEQAPIEGDRLWQMMFTRVAADNVQVGQSVLTRLTLELWTTGVDRSQTLLRHETYVDDQGVEDESTTVFHRTE